MRQQTADRLHLFACTRPRSSTESGW